MRPQVLAVKRKMNVFNYFLGTPKSTGASSS